MARRPRAGRDRAGARARASRERPAACRTATPATTCDLAAHWAHAYIARAERRRRHPEPLRRERARPRRADPRHARAATAGSTSPARGCSPTCGRQLDRGIAQGSDRPVRVRLRVGVSTTRPRTAPAWPSWRACTTSSRHSHRTPRSGCAGSGTSLGANAWGSSFIVGDGRGVPALHPAPGRQHRRLARRDAARAGRRLGRGAELRGDERPASRTMRACPADGGDAFARFNGAAPSTATTSSHTRRSSPRSTSPRRARSPSPGSPRGCSKPASSPAAPTAPRSGGARSGPRRGPRSWLSRSATSVGKEMTRTPLVAPVSRRRARTLHARRSHTARPETAMSDVSRVLSNRIESGEWLR